MAAPPVRLTVLLPTYNRSASVGRSIESVLGQTLSNLELLISDNASEDDTPEVCQSYARRDLRVHYARQPTNLGPIGNFNWLLAQVRTEFALILADDDWLDADYAERCLGIMDGDSSLSIVTGATRYHGDDPGPDLVLNTDLVETSPCRRVLHYLRGSWSSSAFYGILRTKSVSPALPIPNVMGADWLFVAALAFTGPVVTTTTTHLNRTRGGTSANFERIAEVLRLPARSARNPHVAIAFNQFRDIAFSSAAYECLSRPQRLVLGLAAAKAIINGHEFDVLWDAVGPLIMHRRVIWVTGPLHDWWRARRPV